MISFVCAMLALACLAAVGITSFQLLLIPVFVFATIAAIMGAIGIKRLKPGYAIIGMVVGLLAIVGGFMTLALMEI